MAQYDGYTVAYENNRGNKIVLTELPYAINIEPLLDYEWAYASRDRRRGSRVAGFNKAVASEALTVHVLGKTLSERNEAIDNFNNIIEVDIYDGVAGKIWFNDWYTYGYITSAKNSSWQYGIAVAKKEISFVREEETWFHEILKTSYSEIEEEETEYEEGIKDYEVSPYIHEVTETPDNTPYLFRPSPALEEDYDTLLLDKVVGGTLAVNQLFNGVTTSTADGITTEYDANTHIITITNNSRTSNYSSGSNRGYAIAGGAIVGHTYISVFSPTVTGVIISTGGNANSTVFRATQSNYYLRVSSACDFVNTHPVGDVTSLYLNIFDLTQMFGSTIADYVYNLEQSTAGSGVAWLKQYYPSIFNSYQPFNAGSLESVEGLESHDTVGFNQWDEEAESGYINVNTGENAPSGERYRSKNYIKILPNTDYYFKASTHAEANNVVHRFYYYDENKDFITAPSATTHSHVFTTPSNAFYMRFFVNEALSNYNDDICINISSSRNGEYEPYTQTSYPLDSDLVLRGIPKLENGVPYYDGDIYKSDGTVTRKYGVVDLGTLNWSVLSGSPYGIFTTTALNQLAKQDPTKPTYICNAYDEVAFNTASSTADKYIWLNNNKTLIVKDTSKASMTAAEFKTAMSGVYLVYELATPTTETADTYDRVQECYKGGTEEFLSGNLVPVGHETKYGLANVIGYDYAYDYGVDRQSMTNIVNPNPLGCNWRISISGPVVNPYVRIGDTVVNVNVEVPDGAFLVVDSSAKDIMLTLADGTEINAFGARNPDYYIFALIDSGVNPIIWDGSFNWQLQMIEERSEPRWLMA